MAMKSVITQKTAPPGKVADRFAAPLALPAVIEAFQAHWRAADQAVLNARSLMADGWPERALPLLLKALVWRPDHANAAQNLAEALEMIGEKHGAEMAWRRCHFLRSAALPPPAALGETNGDEPPAQRATPAPVQTKMRARWKWLTDGCRRVWVMRPPMAQGWRSWANVARLVLEIGAVLLIRAMRPVVRIRFGGLRVDRIGHFCIETDMYLGERNAGKHGCGVWDGLFFETQPCNAVLARMARRKLPISPIFQSLSEVNGCFKGAGAHEVFSVSRRLYRSQDREGVLVGAPPFLELTEQERAAGARALRRLGVPPGARHICFHTRDSAYPTARFGAGHMQVQHHRNATIEDFLPAVERLTARGFYAIRMGNMVEQPLRTANSRIIDYASMAPDDLTDIYLPMTCAFFLGTTSGLLHVARLARKPILLSNFLPLQLMPPSTTEDIVIPKRIYRRGETTPLSLRTQIENDFHTFLTDEEYVRAELIVEANTPEEIADAAEELALRAEGRWRDTPEDLQRQAVFAAAIRRTALVAGGPVCRIASSYLRRNSWLLEGL